MVKLIELSRSEFVNLKKNFVHPSKEILAPEQLIGRDAQMGLLRNCFERDGSHAFIWGQRGVGKTSLAHSACAEFSELIKMGPAISCQPNSTVNQLFADIVRRAVQINKGMLSDKNFSVKLSAYGVGVEAQLGGGFTGPTNIESVNQASDLLATLFPTDFSEGKKTAIIIDEFDTLANNETIGFLTSLAKQMSVDDVAVKFVFCGVASDFEHLVGSHESVGRYLTAVSLPPLSDDSIWEIIDNISVNFGVKLHRGQKIRVGQIACGYPSFAHLILDEVLNVAYEEKFNGVDIPQDIFDAAMRRAAAGAATNLQSAYEAATLKGTDRYVEILWAAANGAHIQLRQYKDIENDYKRIMTLRPHREEITSVNGIRNHLNALCKKSNGSVLSKPKNSWYKFVDPMFRGYVRMIAYNEGIELGNESFPA